MNLLVTGATGMVGGEVLRQAALDPAITRVTALVRRAPDFRHPKVHVVLHQDFLQYDHLAGLFRQHDACLWCLGISQSQVTGHEYQRVTYDYAVAAATAMRRANPAMAFVFVSAQGVRSAGYHPARFVRVKGRTEMALRSLGFPRLVIARPGGIIPVRAKVRPPLIERVFVRFLPFFQWLAPSLVIRADELARVLIALAGSGGQPLLILSNRELQRAGLGMQQKAAFPLTPEQKGSLSGIPLKFG